MKQTAHTRDIEIHIYIYTHTYTHIYTHIHIHIHIHIYTHPCIYAYKCKGIHTYKYIYMHTYMSTHTYMHIYLYIYSAYAHPVASVKQMCTLISQHLSNVHTCTCMVLNNTCKYMKTLRRNIYGLVYVYTHIHICMYTYTRIHAYSYICILAQEIRPNPR